jgi:nucleotidyltransferase substrate binding protein (TIGR01987 family)
MADQPSPLGPLLLGPLERAAASLAAALVAPENEFVRDAIVKRFEFTYELSWKLMRRHLAWAALEAAPETRKDLIRAAARAGLVDDPEAWFTFNEARNLTAHAYSEANAKTVIAAAQRLLPAAEALLAARRRHHGA